MTAEARTSQETAALVARRLAERHGEFAVIGLGRSGSAASRLLRRAGLAVYASDVSATEAAQATAASLTAIGAAVDVGRHDLARIAKAAVVVVSPGVPPEAPPLVAARAAHVPIVSEVEIALRLMPGLRYLAVTGTNGKTTVTALMGHMLRALGQRAVDVGNIGTPVSELAMEEHPPTWASLEMSSFQLHDTPGMLPDVGILTTLSPDHLDRYPSIASYYADKRLLFANATAASRWVATADNADVDALIRDIPGQWWRFSVIRQDVAAYYDRDAAQLMILGAPLMARADVPLAGDHNIANVLSAALAVMVADPAFATADARARIAEAVRAFRAPPHRLEPVHEQDGVLWLNDSKATNVASARVALEGMTRPTVVLLGGRHKGEPYTTLIEPLTRVARAVIAYGEAADAIISDLRGPLTGTVPVEHCGGRTFAEVMHRARALAKSGDAVLLSPACSSYDMFANFEERGRTFAQLARGDT